MEYNTTPSTPTRLVCGCGQTNPPAIPPSNDDNCGTCMGSIGYSFVPVQVFKDIFSPSDGLSKGTIFRELHKPFGIYGAEVE